MSRRSLLIGSLALTGLAITGTATALAVGGHGPRHRIAARVVSAAIDEMLDEARATPEQRARIHAARDRVFATIGDRGRDRHARFEEALALFESDRLEAAQLEAIRDRHEAEHRRVADTVAQAITEAHDTLTPEQRRIVTGWIRAHRSHGWRGMH
jgi:Spy/CpxP family protein refolding chaperone